MHPATAAGGCGLASLENNRVDASDNVVVVILLLAGRSEEGYPRRPPGVVMVVRVVLGILSDGEGGVGSEGRGGGGGGGREDGDGEGGGDELAELFLEAEGADPARGRVALVRVV